MGSGGRPRTCGRRLGGKFAARGRGPRMVGTHRLDRERAGSAACLWCHRGGQRVTYSSVREDSSRTARAPPAEDVHGQTILNHLKPPWQGGGTTRPPHGKCV